MGDFDGRRWLRSVWGRMLGHDRCWREGSSSAVDRHGGKWGLLCVLIRVLSVKRLSWHPLPGVPPNWNLAPLSSNRRKA